MEADRTRRAPAWATRGGSAGDSVLVQVSTESLSVCILKLHLNSTELLLQGKGNKFPMQFAFLILK